jgi:hypothetical protein
MESISKSEKIAWGFVLIFSIIFFIILLTPTNKQSQYKICYSEKDSVHCDTVEYYKIISFLGLDSCYTYTLEDSTQKIICGNCQIEKLK